MGTPRMEAFALVSASGVVAFALEGQEIGLSAHAARRWALRVRARPDMRMHEIIRDVKRMWTHAELRERQPDWCEAQTESAWVWIGDQIAMPVIGGTICTVLTPGGVSDKTREKRKLNRKARQASKRRRIDTPRPVRNDKPRLHRAVRRSAPS